MSNKKPDRNDVPLPDTNAWRPRDKANETLRDAFLRRCSAAEELILARVRHERQFNVDNFDSGPGVEDSVREVLRDFLPARYGVGAGQAVDRDGFTAGDCDVVISNEFWFPVVKPGATAASRRVLFPIEGVYAIGEVKQTLSYQTLDVAAEKLVKCHRLRRPQTYAHRVVENRETSPCPHGLTNPLYSFIIGIGLADGVSIDDLINRFFDLNASLKRLEVVRCLCVLNEGTVVWAFQNPATDELAPAAFRDADLYEPIFPCLVRMDKHGSALYSMVENLLPQRAGARRFCVLLRSEFGGTWCTSAEEL